MARNYYDRRSFRNGGDKCSVFNCDICGCRTRMTTQNDDRFCGQCYNLLSMQNSLWDDGAENFVRDGFIAQRDRLAAEIAKLSGSATAVVAYMPDLFGKGSYELPEWK